MSARWMFVALAALLAGCNAAADLSPSSWGNRSTGAVLPASVDYYPDDEVLLVAKNHFRQGNYGHSARYFERAVEVAPSNAEAWLGLAGSYDRIRRFDLADRAYRRAAEFVSHRAEFHNNVGYSYLLRGEVVKAKDKFLEAQAIDPKNPTVLNNLQLLRDAVRVSRRD